MLKMMDYSEEIGLKAERATKSIPFWPPLVTTSDKYSDTSRIFYALFCNQSKTDYACLFYAIATK